MSNPIDPEAAYVPLQQLERLANFHDEQHSVDIPSCSICSDRREWLLTQADR